MEGAVGGEGSKNDTGIAPQALLATHKINLKFFEVDNIAIQKIRFTWTGGTF